MTMREDYEKRLQKQLADWKVEIDRLWAKAREAQDETAAEYHRQVDKLKAQQQEMEANLEKMRKAGTDSWNDLKSGTEQAWQAMEKAVSAAWSRFR